MLIKRILIITVIIGLCLAGCGQKTTSSEGSGPAEYADERSASEIAFADAQQFERDNPDDLAGIEKAYQACADEYSLSSWGDKAAVEAERVHTLRADTALSEAEVFFRDNPDKRDEAILKFEAIMTSFPGSPQAAKAQARAEGLALPKVNGSVSWENAGEGASPLQGRLIFKGDPLPEGAEAAWRVFEEVLEGNGPTIEHTFDAPGNFHATYTITLKGEVLNTFDVTVVIDTESCRAAFNKEMQAINKLILLGKFDDARTYAERISQWNIPGITDDTDRVRHDIDQVINGLKGFYADLFKHFDANLIAFDYLKALAFAQTYHDNSKNSFEKQIVKREIDRLVVLKRAYNAIENNFRSRQGQPYRLGGISGTISEVGNGKFYLDASGMKYEQAIYLLKSSELMPLMDKLRPEIGDYEYGVFLEYLCMFEEAIDLFKAQPKEELREIGAFLEFKKAVFDELETGIAVKADTADARLDARIAQLGKSEELYELQMKLITEDLKMIELAKEYDYLVNYTEHQRYKSLCYELAHQKDGYSKVELNRMWKKRKAIEKKRPEYVKYAQISERLSKATERNEMRKLQDDLEEIKAGWDAETQVVKDKYDKLVQESKERILAIESVYNNEMRTWNKVAFSDYIKQLQDDIKKKSMLENKRRNLAGRGKQTNPYDDLGEEIKRFYYWRGKARFLHQQGLKRVQRFIVKLNLPEYQLYDEDNYELIHTKMYLEIYLDRGLIEQSRYVGQ